MARHPIAAPLYTRAQCVLMWIIVAPIDAALVYFAGWYGAAIAVLTTAIAFSKSRPDPRRRRSKARPR